MKRTLAPTPNCTGDAAETPPQTEGPYYRPDAPRRSTLGAPSLDQSAFALCGFVLDTDCKPIPGAIVEIWHADHRGAYDNEDFGGRGYQLTDPGGRWGFDTITTHHYAFRTAHYHFRIKVPDSPLLTTQLYFPDHPRNADDPLFDARLVMTVSSDRSRGRYDFVLPSGR